MDFVKDIPVRIGKSVSVDGIRIDDLENITTNKICAIFGRLEVKDYIDLYFIVKKTAIKLDKIFKLAQKKDLGLTEFHFSYIILAAEHFTSFPVMRLPFNPKDFRSFYKNLSRDLLLKIKPKG